MATAPRAAAILRDGILRGDLRSGLWLRETSVAAELGVSRNTLREAFRLLDAEGLIELRLNRGAVVRKVTAPDVRDIYRVRRVLEVHAVEESAAASQDAFTALREASAAVEVAAAQRDWQEVGTAGMCFHQRIVALLDSPKLDAFFRVVLAQLRLAFSEAQSEAAFQLPWIPRSRELCHLICTGQRSSAVAALELYLSQSEMVVLGLVQEGGSNC